MPLAAASPIRRTGTSLALAGAVIDVGAWWWLAQPADGFPFGVGLLLVVGGAVSVAATVVLMASLGRARQEVPRPRWRAVDLAGKVGAALGVVVVAIWLALWVLIDQPIDFTSWQIADFWVFVVASTLMAASRS